MALIEIDERLASLDDWRRYATSNPSVGRSEVGAAIAARIMRNGFHEPLTGRAVKAEEITSPDLNWREGLQANGLNARMRAVLALIDQATSVRSPCDTRIFAAEAITPFALVMRGKFPQYLGSEFFPDPTIRSAMFPIPHQDLTALDLPSACFDFATTNEVIEHVPDIDAALRELARILRPG